MPEIIVKLGDTIVQRYHFDDDKEVISIGRARDNDIIVENLSVSRNHARIRLQDGKHVLTDLNSANGSFVNGVKVSKTELVDEDIVSIGKHKLHFLDKARARKPGTPAPDSPSSQATAGPPPPTATGPGVLLVTRGKQANQIFRLRQGDNSIGRALENEVRLHDWFVSKNHAVIHWDGTAFTLKDMGSWRGTTVNGQPIREALLKENDEIVFGTTVLQFKTGREAEQLLAAPTMIPPDEPDRMERLPDFPERADGDGGEMATREASKLPADDQADPDSISLDAPMPSSSSGEVAMFDDEFAPLTDDELAALEADSESELEHGDDDIAAAAEWEQLEAEKLLEQGGGWKARKGGMIDDHAALEAEEGKFARPRHTDTSFDEHELLDEGEDDEAMDAEEEKALFGGPVADAEPGNLPPVEDDDAPVAPAPVAAAKVFVAAPAPVADEIEVPSGVDPNEFRKWSRGLRNRSKVIRREAARRLKELTGKDYDWESEP